VSWGGGGLRGGGGVGRGRGEGGGWGGGGGDMRLRDGIMYCGLVRIMDFFLSGFVFCNHIMSVKEMDVIMF
jgi:hypothetical protein